MKVLSVVRILEIFTLVLMVNGIEIVGKNLIFYVLKNFTKSIMQVIIAMLGLTNMV